MAFDNVLRMFKFWQSVDDKVNSENLKAHADSVTGPKFDDGALETEVPINTTTYGGVSQHALNNLEIDAKTTRELINTYRSLMAYYEVDNAVQEIVTSAIVYENGHQVVGLDLDATAFTQATKDKILEEFNSILNALSFQRKGTDHFRRWYVDSRVFFHKIIDPNDLSKGIIELRRLDPRNVTFVREIITDIQEGGVKVVRGYQDYFVYDTGQDTYSFSGKYYAPGTKLKIPASAIVYSHSGLVDGCGKNIIGYLHRAVKPSNQLKIMEDALVIYRITRAPDRRIFYIDTGNMPSRKASEHMQHIMNTMRNRVVYDASTGKVKNQQNSMPLTEDYWLQRRDGKAVTEVDTLPGMSGMSDMDDIRYFRKALYMALRVPLSRIPDDQNGQIQFDAGSSITRDELSFSTFIKDLQHKFDPVLLEPLKTNLMLKGILDSNDWEAEINNIKVVFHENSYFAELKDIELLERRANALSQFDPYIGKYISNNRAMKQILKMTDEEIEQERKIIKDELKDPIYKEPEEEGTF